MDAEVHVNGIGVMRASDQRAPRIVISGFAFWDGVDVKRKPTSQERRKPE